MNLESRKERKEHFILLLLLLFSHFSNRSRPSGDQTSTFSGPGHFLSNASRKNYREFGNAAGSHPVSVSNFKK